MVEQLNNLNFFNAKFVPFTIYHLLFTFCLLFFAPYVSATALQGGVSFDVNSARQYVQDGQPNGVDIPDTRYEFQADNIEKIVTSYNNSGEAVGVTVQYINEPTKTYIYKKGHLAYVEKYDKPINIYPHRGYRYNLDGKLVSTSLSATKNELFRFDSNGKLLVHSINGVIYDENGKVIGNGK